MRTPGVVAALVALAFAAWDAWVRWRWRRKLDQRLRAILDEMVRQGHRDHSDEPPL